MKTRTKTILSALLLFTLNIQIFLFDQCLMETRSLGDAKMVSIYYLQRVAQLQTIKLLSKNNPEAVEPTLKYISYARLDEEISSLQKKHQEYDSFLKEKRRTVDWYYRVFMAIFFISLCLVIFLLRPGKNTTLSPTISSQVA